MIFAESLTNNETRAYAHLVYENVLGNISENLSLWVDDRFVLPLSVGFAVTKKVLTY